MHFFGDIEQSGQTLNAATINQPDITINIIDTVYIAEPVYTIDPAYIIDVESIELITVDIICTHLTNDPDTTDNNQSHNTPTEYKAELLHSPDMPLIKVQTPDISDTLNEKIPLPQ